MEIRLFEAGTTTADDRGSARDAAGRVCAALPSTPSARLPAVTGADPRDGQPLA
jgi:hypothetical protein